MTTPLSVPPTILHPDSSSDRRFLVKPATLRGELFVQGSKNAAMMCIPMACLADQAAVTLENVPVGLRDVRNFLALLSENGVLIEQEDNRVTMQAQPVAMLLGGELSLRIRHSLLLLGLGAARGVPVELPNPGSGGCRIGDRKFDLHVDGLRALGAHIEETDDYVRLEPRPLVGTRIELYYPTFSGTVNLLMAATAAEGQTVIANAARNPEILAAVALLNALGGSARYLDDRTIIINGKRPLRSATFDVPSDRIVCANAIAAVAATGGEAVIRGVPSQELASELTVWRRSGVSIKERDLAVLEVRRLPTDALMAVDVTTGPYPAFHTDIQPFHGVLMTQAIGQSTLKDTILDDRFIYMAEMRKMGLSVDITDGDYVCVNGQPGKTVTLAGPQSLTGSTLSAPDIRGGAALIVAALMADSPSTVTQIEFIERGYADIPRMYRDLGASVTLLTDHAPAD